MKKLAMIGFSIAVLFSNVDIRIDLRPTRIGDILIGVALTLLLLRMWRYLTVRDPQDDRICELIDQIELRLGHPLFYKEVEDQDTDRYDKALKRRQSLWGWKGDPEVIEARRNGGLSMCV